MLNQGQLKFQRIKRVLSVYVFHVFALLCSYYLAYELRFDFDVPDNFHELRNSNLLWVLGLKLLFLRQAGQFKSIMVYFRLHDALRLFVALALVGFCMLFLWYSLGGSKIAPRSVILTDFLLGFFIIAAFRIALRLRLSGLYFQHNRLRHSRDVIIIGAGSQGARLCAELMSSRRANFFPVAFIDDDRKLIGCSIHGVPVEGALHQMSDIAYSYGVEDIIIAISNISVKQIREIIRLAEVANLKVQRIEKHGTQVGTTGMLSQIRSVECEAFLGREPAKIDVSSVANYLRGQTILITGAGGTIGRELLQQILRYQPHAVVGIDQSELAIFSCGKIWRRCLTMPAPKTHWTCGC